MDVVVRDSAGVFEVLAGNREIQLVLGEALIVLDPLLELFDRVEGLNLRP